MSNPYESLPGRAFWRTGAVESDPSAMHGIWEPRFGLPRGTRVATAGSCFAQNLRAPFAAAGLDMVDAEPAPPGLTGQAARAFGYGLYSARYGNVYTARDLRQMLADARDGAFGTADVWWRNGRAIDAQRPGVEPDGLGSAEEVLAHRLFNLQRVLAAFVQAEVVVFTLGLTETWMDGATGRVFPTAPGVLAVPEATQHVGFHNFDFVEVLDDLRASWDMLRDINPTLRLILTVSPVPLTATASGAHVLAATSYSKAVLRAAASAFCAETPEADYFPSFEIVTNPAARGRFFQSNLRNVTTEGVTAVMDVFLDAHGLSAEIGAPEPPIDDADGSGAVICEEALLDAFRP